MHNFTPTVVKSLSQQFLSDDNGVTAVEYVIVSVIMSTIVLIFYTNGELGNLIQRATSIVVNNLVLVRSMANL